MELTVGDRPMLSVFTLPEIRRLVLAPGFHVSVQGVLGRVQRSSNEPLGKRRVPFPHPFPCLLPDQFTRDFGPQGFWISKRILLGREKIFLRLGRISPREGCRC